MANLTPTSSWDNVLQLELTTPATGGPGGVANAQAQALLNRTEKLRQDTSRVLDFSRDFGVLPSNTAAQNNAAFAAAFAYIATHLPNTIELAPGTYEANDFGNWAHSGLTVRVANGARLKLVGSNDTGLLFKAFPNDLSSEPFIQACNIEGELVLDVPSTCIYPVRLYGLARCDWPGRIRVIGGNSSTGRAVTLNACSINRLNFTCSTDQDAMSSIPYYGIELTGGTRQGVSLGASTDNVIDIRMEGVAVGLLGTYCDNNTFTGTAESCTQTGVIWEANARSNILLNVGMEGNATYDVIDRGINNRAIEGYGISPLGYLANSGARGARVDGGKWERINFQADATDCRADGCWINYAHQGQGGFFADGPGCGGVRLYGGAITASFSGTVMTVSAATPGVYLEAGQTINVSDGSGARVSTTISSLGTGTGGTGTYNLTATLGTLSSRGVRVDAPIHPQRPRVGVSVTGTSTFSWRNNTREWVEVALASTTLTALTRTRGGVDTSLATALPAVHAVGPGDTLTVAWSGGGGAAPTFRYETMGCL